MGTLDLCQVQGSLLLSTIVFSVWTESGLGEFRAVNVATTLVSRRGGTRGYPGLQEPGAALACTVAGKLLLAI
jgi:hypothetical protein